MKKLKFEDKLAKMILAGEKNSTWRIFDEKNLQEGDSVSLINVKDGDIFAEAKLLKVYEKTLRNLTSADMEGHEKFSSPIEMLKTYQRYYGDAVTFDTVVKIVYFEILKSPMISVTKCKEK